MPGSAQKIKAGLGAKSYISKFIGARKYRRAASNAYRYAKVTFTRDLSYCISSYYYFCHSLNQTEAGNQQSLVGFAFALVIIRELDTGQGLEDIYERVIRTAKSLYRCSFSCKDAFPSPEMKEKLAKFVWNEACAREGANPQLMLREDKEAGLFLPHSARIHTNFQFVFNSMELVTDIRKNIKHAVESLYEFDTSRAPDNISRNATRVRALLIDTKFVYRVRLIYHHLRPTEHRHGITGTRH
jgi:hypothetical protein